MKKLIIEAAVNEAASKEINAHIPYGPDEIAADAIACTKAGASIVHFHARDPESGEQAWTGAGLYAEAMRLIEKESDVILYPTYSARLPLEERYSHVAALAKDSSVRFEMGTIDLGVVNMAPFDAETKTLGREFVYNNTHADVAAFLQLAKQSDIIYNLGVREPGHLRHALAYREMGLLREPLIFKFFFTDRHAYGLPPTAGGLQAYLDMIPPDLPHEWFIQSYGETHGLMQSLAIAMGGHVRTGAGDNPVLAGKVTTSAGQVEAFAELAKTLGREIASPNDARATLGLAR